jgi:hypothetical protein
MVNWKGFRRERSWPNLGYYPSICLEELRKAKKKTLFRVADLRAEI